MEPERGPVNASHRRGALLVLVLTYAVALLLRGAVWSGDGVDEVFYFAQGSSLAWDGDFDLTNDVVESRGDLNHRLWLGELLHLGDAYGVPFSLGMGFAAWPMHGVARWLDGATGGWLGGLDRFAYIHRAPGTLVTWLAVLAGLMALQRVMARWCGEWRALAGVGVLFLATPLAYYTWHAPQMAHGLSFGMVALVLWGAVRLGEAPTPGRALAVGALVGGAFLARWQEVLVGALPAAVLVAALAGGRIDTRRFCLCAALMAGGALVMATPQLMLWQRLYDTPVTAPQGEAFFAFDVSRPMLVLLSPLNGWWYTHPLAGLLTVSWVFVLSGRGGFDARCRPIAWAALAVVLAQIVVNSMAGDWWAGGSFGGRRFTSMTALLAVPMAVVLARAWACGFAVRMIVGGALGVAAVVGFLTTSWWPVQHGLAFSWSAMLLEPLPLVWLGSDLFVPGAGVDRGAVLWMVFLALVGMVAAAGLITLRWCAALLSRRLAWPLLGGVLVYTLAWALMLPPIDQRHAEAQRLWTRTGSALIADDEWDAAWVAILEQTSDAGHDLPPVLALRRLQALLTEGDFAGAQALSLAMQPVVPRSISEAWARHSRVDAPHRGAWAAAMDAHRDPAPGVLLELALVATREGDQDRADFLFQRLSGPGWLRRMWEFHRCFARGEGATILRAAATAAMQANPRNPAPVLEMVRLDSAHPADAARHLARLYRITEGTARMDAYIRGWMPDMHRVFRHQRHDFFAHRFHGARAVGDVAAMEALLEQARRGGLDGDHLTSFEVLLDRSRLYERHLKGEQTERDLAWEPPIPMPWSKDWDGVTGPGWMEMEEGWGELEANQDGSSAWRWNERGIVFLRPNVPMRAGTWRVMLGGFAPPATAGTRPVVLDLYGEETRAEFDAPTGWFTREVVLHLPRDVSRPVLRLQQQLLPLPGSTTRTGQPRRVGMMVIRCGVRREGDAP